MKPFKFRVWNKEYKRWEYSYSLNKEGKLEEVCCFHGDAWASEIENQEDYEISYSTGIFDKNGKEIFEGDILKKEYNNGRSYEVLVEFKIMLNCGDCFNDSGIGFDFKSAITDEEEFSKFTIIGNKYENTELLEKV